MKVLNNLRSQCISELPVCPVFWLAIFQHIESIYLYRESEISGVSLDFLMALVAESVTPFSIQTVAIFSGFKYSLTFIYIVSLNAVSLPECMTYVILQISLLILSFNSYSIGKLLTYTASFNIPYIEIT